MKTITYKAYTAFLKSLGLVHKSTKGSHEKWDFPKPSPLERSIIVQATFKEIAALHISTNRSTLVVGGIFKTNKEHDEALAKF